MAILLDEHTRVVIQGATGGYGLNQMNAMRQSGTQVVGLVSPGRGGLAGPRYRVMTTA